MTGNTFKQRVLDAIGQNDSLTLSLVGAARAAGYEDEQIAPALEWTAIQLDPEADDYETWECTLLARLADPDGTGER